MNKMSYRDKNPEAKKEREASRHVWKTIGEAKIVSIQLFDPQP